jgi:hypothetical protein
MSLICNRFLILRPASTCIPRRLACPLSPLFSLFSLFRRQLLPHSPHCRCSSAFATLPSVLPLFPLFSPFFAVFASLLTPNPTLSYTFLRFPTPPKPAPHQTFLHFPTLPTLFVFLSLPALSAFPTLIAFPLLRTKSVPSPYQVRSKAAPFSLQFRTVNARESYPHPTKSGALVPP